MARNGGASSALGCIFDDAEDEVALSKLARAETLYNNAVLRAEDLQEDVFERYVCEEMGANRLGKNHGVQEVCCLLLSQSFRLGLRDWHAQRIG